MNKTKKNFWLDVILFIAFIAVTFSSFVLDNHDSNLILWGLTRPAWVTLHVVSALVMLAGSALHLGWHWDWIKAAFKRTNRPKPTQVRRNRTVDMGLFGLFILICLSGLLIWPLAGNLAEGNPLRDVVVWGMTFGDWKLLHAWGAVAMLGLMLVHLALHWGWIISTGRCCLPPGVRLQAKKMVEA